MVGVPESLEPVDSIVEMLHVFSRLTTGRTAARFAVLHLAEPSVKELPLRRSRWAVWDVRSESPYFALLWQQRTDTPLGAHGVREVPLAFLAEVDGCAVLSSLSRSNIFAGLVDSMVHDNYPYIGRTSMDTDFLLDALGRIDADDSCSDFVVSGVTCRTQIASRGGKRQWETARRWTDLTMAALAREVRATQARAISITFSFGWTPKGVGAAKRVIVGASANRHGIFTTKGDAAVMWEFVVKGAAHHTSIRRRLLSGRARGRCFERPARPLAIEYSRPVFADKARNAVLVRCLRELRNSSLSVYHGNPYLHAVLTDRLDGSTFSIWVLGAERIIVVPGGRATSVALDRLVSHVTSNFREGQIRDFPTHPAYRQG